MAHDLTDEQKNCIKMVASDKTKSFSTTALTSDGQVLNFHDVEGDDGGFDTQAWGTIIAAQIATVSTPDNVDEVCELLAGITKDLMKGAE